MIFPESLVEHIPHPFEELVLHFRRLWSIPPAVEYVQLPLLFLIDDSSLHARTGNLPSPLESLVVNAGSLGSLQYSIVYGLKLSPFLTIGTPGMKYMGENLVVAKSNLEIIDGIAQQEGKLLETDDDI